ncbi:MAG: response regulator [Alphaproteobacteria bacterium]
MAKLPPSGARTYAGRRALVVEHDGETRSRYRTLLEGLGFQVRSVERGAAAIEAAREVLPDVVLMDVQLSDVSGLEAARWLKSEPALRAIPVIASSTMTFAKGDRALAESGVNVLLHKPVPSQHLSRAIHAVLEDADGTNEGRAPRRHPSKGRRG